MRYELLRGGLWLSLLAMPIAATAQNSLTSRALGMGGAFIAIAEGDGAVNWNPAAAANSAGRRFAPPNLSLLNTGAGQVADLLNGLPSNWNDRFALIRKWSAGITDFDGTAFSGYSAPGFAFSLAAEGTGQIVPYDANGVAGHTPLSPSFTLSALHDAAVNVYTEAGFTPTQASNQAAKIIAKLQTDYPGATNISLPVYKSRIVANADAYAAGIVTLARQTRPGLRVGINLKMVAAAHLIGSADFGKETFGDLAAKVTGGTASPALVDRVLKQLNLRNSDGSFYSADQLAGSSVQTSSWNGLEIRPTADVGALWQATNRLQAGLVMRNLVPARFNSAAPMDTHFDLGCAYVLKPKSLMAAIDFTNLLDSAAARVNVGLEWRTPAHIALRTGLYHGRMTVGAGLGSMVNVAFTPGMSVMSFGVGF
jgi:hypothetical protein